MKNEISTCKTLKNQIITIILFTLLEDHAEIT